MNASLTVAGPVCDRSRTSYRWPEAPQGPPPADGFRGMPSRFRFGAERHEVHHLGQAIDHIILFFMATIETDFVSEHAGADQNRWQIGVE